MSILYGEEQSNNLFDLGFDKNLVRGFSAFSTPEMLHVISEGTSPRTLTDGEIVSIMEQQFGVIFSAKTAFTNVIEGFRLGIDPSDDIVKFFIGDSTNYLNWDGTTFTIAGAINATSGFFGSSTDGITITSNGISIVGSGYIRTFSSGSRAELVRSGTVNSVINVVFDAYDSAEFQYLAVSPSTGLYLRSNDDIDRSVLRYDAGSYAGRITSQGFMNFPAYRHRSEFDEAANAWASTTLAKIHWTLGGTSGTAEIVNSAALPHALLSTTATANRSATITFSRQFDLSVSGPGAGLEFYMEPNFTTNGRWFLGWYKDATHYVGFIFDTVLSASNIYFGWANGGGDNVIDSDVDVSTSLPKRYTIYRKGGSISATTMYAMIDGVSVSVAAGNPFDPDTGYFPFAYVDNKAAAQDNRLKIQYIDVYAGRDI